MTYLSSTSVARSNDDPKRVLDRSFPSRSLRRRFTTRSTSSHAILTSVGDIPVLRPTLGWKKTFTEPRADVQEGCLLGHERKILPSIRILDALLGWERKREKERKRTRPLRHGFVDIVHRRWKNHPHPQKKKKWIGTRNDATKLDENGSSMRSLGYDLDPRSPWMEWYPGFVRWFHFFFNHSSCSIEHEGASITKRASVPSSLSLSFEQTLRAPFEKRT